MSAGFGFITLLIPLLILTVVLVVTAIVLKGRGGAKNQLPKDQPRAPAEEEFNEELRRAKEDLDS